MDKAREIYERQEAKDRHEARFQKLISQARKELRQTLDRIEQEEVDEQ